MLAPIFANLPKESSADPVQNEPQESTAYSNFDFSTLEHMVPKESYELAENIAPIFGMFGRRDPRLYVTLKMENKPILALVDSRSTRTYAGPKVAKLLGDFDPSSAVMTAANNNTVEVDGKKLIKYKLFDISHDISTRYIKTLPYDHIMGLDFLEKFGIMVDFAESICRLPGGRSWKVDFLDSSSPFSANFIHLISATDHSGDSRLFVNVTIKGITVKALVDSGSTRTYLGKVFEPALKDSLIPVDAKVLLADNSVEKVLGEISTQLTLQGKRKALPVRLVRSLGYDCILGIDFLKAFGIQIDFGSRSWSHHGNSESVPFESLNGEPVKVDGVCAGLSELDARQRVKVEALLRRLIREPGKNLSTTNLTRHNIELSDPAPIRKHPRRTSPAMLKITQDLVNKYKAEGIIEPCKSPWNSPPVLARKSDGLYRLCIDFRKLHSRTKKHAHPIPNVDRLLDKFANAKYISKIDMTLAFLQVKIVPECRDYTAFSVEGRGQYRFKRMCFGLTNSPSTYQEMMDQLIRSLPPGADDHVFSYLDDLCIVTETFEDHLKWLEIVITGLRDANLEVNREKSEFCCPEVRYLGYIVDS